MKVSTLHWHLVFWEHKKYQNLWRVTISHFWLAFCHIVLFASTWNLVPDVKLVWNRALNIDPIKGVDFWFFRVHMADITSCTKSFEWIQKIFLMAPIKGNKKIIVIVQAITWGILVGDKIDSADMSFSFYSFLRDNIIPTHLK